MNKQPFEEEKSIRTTREEFLQPREREEASAFEAELPEETLPEQPEQPARKKRPRRKKPEEAPGEGRKKPALRHFIALGLVLLVVLFTVSVFLFPETFNLDRMIRFFRYLGLRNQEGYGVIVYEANASNAYGGFDGCLLVGSDSSLSLYDLEGTQKSVIQGNLPNPVLNWGDQMALCFSPGNSYLAAVGKGGKILLDETVSGTLLDADVSTDGYVCYLTSESGYKSAATVRNSGLETVFRMTSRTRYLNACTVNKGGSLLAVASLGEDESIFRSEITILRTGDELADLDAEDSTAVRVDLGNQVIYDLEFISDNSLCAIGQDEITILDRNGKVLEQIVLGSVRLTDYAFSSKGFGAFLLRQEGTGEHYQILTLDGAGKQLGSLEVDEKVRSISAEGKYVAVLTDRSLKICSRKLAAYAETGEIYSSNRVVARADGTALLVGSTTTRLYIP